MKFLICLALVALINSGAAEARSAQETVDRPSTPADSGPRWAASDIRTITTSIDFPLESIVGPVRAGLMCLPNSKLRGRDFVRSQKDLTLLVQQVASEQEADGHRLNDVEINFKGLSVKLCAKSWGVFGTGDRQDLSGEANFVFDWSGGSPPVTGPRTVRLEIKVGKGEAMPSNDIMREAVNQLLARIRKAMP